MTKILTKNFLIKITAIIAVVLIGSFSLVNKSMADVIVTPASGGTNISADNAANATSPAWTTLGNIVITSNGLNDIAKNQTNVTLILTAPSGWNFNAGVGSGSVSGAAITFVDISVTSSTITFTYTRSSFNSSDAAITISGIQVRSTNGSVLPNSGNILRTSANPGTASIIGITNDVTNFGSLSQVVGAKNKLALTVQPSGSATINTDFATKPAIVLQDQFSNTVTTDSVSTISRTAVLSNQVCGGTAGLGVLSSTPVNGAAVTSGVLTYTAMQYSAAENIKICFSSTGVISVLSNEIVVSAASDLERPVVTAFDIPATSDSLTVPINTFTATDNVGVTGYLVNESASTPLGSDPNWSATAQTSYVFSTAGSKTLYAWAKDAAGNISTSLNDSVTITLPETTVISDSEIQDTISSGIIVPNDTLTSSSQITFTQEVQINFLTGAKITVPINTVMSSGTNVDFSQLSATSNVSSSSLSADSISYNFGGAISFGLPTNSLSSDKIVTINIFAGSSYNGQTLPVFKKNAGSSAWNKLTTCVISSGLCQFTTNSFSSFVVGLPISQSVSSGSYIPTLVTFYGRAHPGGKIRVYRRSLIENIVTNDYLPNFDITVTEKGDFAKEFVGLFEYNYLFTLEPFDKNGISGGIIAFNTTLTSSDRLTVENIFFPPTISIQNKIITKGNEIKITGYAYPGSEIELKIDNILRVNTTANTSGYYEAVVDTARFSPKEHFVMARQIDKNGVPSNFSVSKNFTVSALNFPQADFNGDNIIDIKDWSIFLYRWNAGPTLRAFNDLNNDGKVDALDLSIFMRAFRESIIK